MRIFKAKYGPGDKIYLVLGEHSGIVTDVKFDSSGGARYLVRWSDNNVDWHDEIELTNEKRWDGQPGSD